MKGDIIFLALIIFFWILYLTRKKWNPDGSAEIAIEKIVGALSVMMFWPIMMFYFNKCWHEPFQIYRDQEDVFLVTQLIIGLAIGVWIIFRLSKFSWKHTFWRSIFIVVVLIFTSIHGPIYVSVKSWIEGLVAQQQKKLEPVKLPEPVIVIKNNPEPVAPIVPEIKKEPDTPQIRIVYIEKPKPKEAVVEEDSIVREAVLGEWSDWAFLKNSPKDPGALKIRIKSTGPVRVERDRICNVYREPETSDIIHGNEIGGYVSNWCVRFTSLSENTERVVIYFPKKR